MVETKADLQKLTVAKLKSRLSGLELDTSGRKADLVERLWEAISTEEEEEEEVDYAKLNVTQLRNLCSDRGISSSGKRAALVARLEQNDEEGDAKEEEEVAEEAEEEKVDYSSFSVVKLRKLCGEKGLETTGRKAELVERLQSSGTGAEEDEEMNDIETKQTGKRTRAQAKETNTTTKRASTRKAKKIVESDSESSESSEEEAPPPKKRAKSPQNVGKAEVDELCSFRGRGASVHGTYACMLNQTNIANNNNKFYVIQIVNYAGTYYNYTRWGRVGEPGRNACKAARSLDAAITEFGKKFKSKTGNVWGQPFVAKTKLYTQIEMDYTNQDEMAEKLAQFDDEEDDAPKRKIVTAKSTLDKQTQEFISLIFNQQMFTEQMKSFDLNVKKMPLGQLSKKQIQDGYAVLEKVKKHLDSGSGISSLESLTNEFYTKIPHSFGRTRPPLLSDAEIVQQKMEMLAVLGDIEIAVNLGEKKTKTKKNKKGEIVTEQPNPLDQHYESLKCDLEYVENGSDEFNLVQKYATNTASSYRKPKILSLWRVDRQNEGDRFSEHSDLGNRKLLWHGTNIAVVAAILNSGLRIMPHSGGRVGRGIYFASENGKSAAYVSCHSNGTGVMFLGEAALGKEHHIDTDDPSLRSAPAGYDSIVAQGRQEPDSKGDEEIELDGNTVVVPTGRPINRPKWNHSRFQNSEYLVYKESQARLRYVMTIEFTR